MWMAELLVMGQGKDSIAGGLGNTRTGFDYCLRKQVMISVNDKACIGDTVLPTRDNQSKTQKQHQ